MVDFTSGCACAGAGLVNLLDRHQTINTITGIPFLVAAACAFTASGYAWRTQRQLGREW